MKQLFEKQRDEYLSQQKKQKNHVYQNHINKFVSYLLHRDLANEPRSVDLNTIRDYIGEEVKNNKIKTQDTLISQVQSIKDFYLFMFDITKILPSNRFSEITYTQFIEELIARYNLPERIPRGFFNNDTIEEILTSLRLDLRLDEDKFDNSYNPLALYLFICLTLIVPAKPKRICSLKLNEFSDEYQFLEVNSVRIRLPDSLQKLIVSTLEIKNGGRRVTDLDKELFKLICGEDFDSTKLCYWLSVLFKKYNIENLSKDVYSVSVEKIRNSAVNIMSQELINLEILSKISGISSNSLQKYYSDDFYETNHQKICEIYSKELSRIKYYKSISF